MAGCVLGATACASGRAPERTLATPATPVAPPSSDPRREEVKHVIRSLSLDAPDLDRHFSPGLRAETPQLRAHWRERVAQNGVLETFSIVGLDHPYGKERYVVELDFARGTLNALIVFEPTDVEVIGVFFLPVRHEARAEPVATAPDPAAEEIALSVGKPPFALGASLTLPRTRGDARLAAVLLVPGSGTHDRDETALGMKPFLDIARGLAHRNVATLRFDERFFAHPELARNPHITVEDELIADAVAAMAVLRGRPEVDPQRLFVAGHSLGAMLAPEIAERSGGMAGLILLAAPARPLTESLLLQLRDRGAPPEAIASVEQQIKAIPSAPPERIVLGVPAGYWQDLARRDEIAKAQQLGLPILYLRGELDRNVFASDHDAWARAFAGNAAFESVTLRGLTHSFAPETTGGASAHVSEEVIARIADFTARRRAARSP